MVVKIMKWRPWPSNCSKKMQVRLTLHRLEGIPQVTNQTEGEQGIMIDVKWKGPKSSLGLHLGRTPKRGRTSHKMLEESGIITWDEDFEHDCIISMGKKTSLQPWNVHFIVLQASKQGSKRKLSVRGTAVLNVADFMSLTENVNQTLRVRITHSVDGGTEASLVVTINCIELRNANEALDPSSWIRSPSLSCIGGNMPKEIDKILGKCTSDGRSWKKVSGELEMLDDGKLSSKSGESSHNSRELFDSDSIEDSNVENIGADEDDNIRNSFSYGTLAGVNLLNAGALLYYSDDTEDNSADKAISIHNRTVAEAIPKVADEVCNIESNQIPLQQPTTRSLLSWRKRKLGFRSPRARGEPLLNKSYGEDGGDDIDFDRRQSHSPIDLLCASRQKKDDDCSTVSGYLDFGDELFSIGSWERKTLLSRDRQLKLTTNVFFASIDQRNERAAGESACTALVAVIADWLHHNPNRMPIRAEFDTLIRDGSAEWRKICEIDSYKDRFPDRHFDLDTILQAEVRPLRVAPERSFIGFFQPEGLGECCDFLQGAMSFESIWDAIWEELASVKPEELFEPAVYIVSWNDHFFVLKAERDAYYIIDTLGERLYEGCSQAYILRFDKDTSLCNVSRAEVEGQKDTDSRSPSKPATSSYGASASMGSENTQTLHEKTEKNGCEGASISPKSEMVDENVIYEGREACKHFLKGFFAALPLTELQNDFKKGLIGKVPLHRRLQIEFDYTLLQSTKEVVAL